MTTQKPTAPGIVFVPHTHWDREWYEPFQVFRFRLVEALDQVIETAERDPRYRFTLDGQAAAIEDYLEIRPENTERVRALVAAGQLAIGPWLILLDEFLCSGETIVRNLQLGWASAEALGGAMRIGYLPDMFGHTAQIPQILRRAGIEHAAFWRGVPGRVSGHAFRWEAPDGSSVRVEYLFDGYGNGLDALLVPERIGEALREYRDRTATRWGDDPVLGMVGTDHMAPNPALMDWVSRFDSPDFPIRVATLQQYIEGLANDRDHTPEPVVVRGELRSHARGNILPGVLSIRLGLKEAMARAERTVGEAERAAATLSHEDFTPFLTTAWRKIVESTAHDSVVGSGTDETVAQVRARLDEAAQIARAVRDGVVREAAHRVSSDAYLAVNTLTRARTALVEVEVAAPRDGVPVTAQLTDGTPLRVQELATTPVVLGDEQLDAADYERVIRRIHRRELFGQDIDRYTIEPGTLTFEVATVPETPSFDLFGLRRELAEATRQQPRRVAGADARAAASARAGRDAASGIRCRRFRRAAGQRERTDGCRAASNRAGEPPRQRPSRRRDQRRRHPHRARSGHDTQRRRPHRRRRRPRRHLQLRAAGLRPYCRAAAVRRDRNARGRPAACCCASAAELRVAAAIERQRRRPFDRHPPRHR